MFCPRTSMDVNLSSVMTYSNHSLETNTTVGEWAPYNATIRLAMRAKYSHFLMIEDTIDRYIIPALCVVGVIGNLSFLVVLGRSRWRRREAVRDTGAQVGLLALALADILFCVAMFPRGFIRSTHSLFPARNFLLVYQAFGTGLVTTLILISTWITVTMAMLRYLGICHPLQSRLIVGRCSPNIAYFLVTLLSVAFNLPSFWQFCVTDMPLDENTTYFLIDIGYMDNNKPRGTAFLWAKLVVGVLLPAILLIFCNFSLVRALKRSYRMRKQCYVKETFSSSGKRLTITLVTIVTAFVILVFPSELMDFFMVCIKMDVTRTETFLLVRSLANTLQVLNFSCNVFLYCCVNSTYRNSLKHVLCTTESKENNEPRLKSVIHSFKTTSV